MIGKVYEKITYSTEKAYDILLHEVIDNEWEFVPTNHDCQSQNKLFNLKPTTFVSKSLSDFRNIIHSIPKVSTRERLDQFFNGPKTSIYVEVMKPRGDNFGETPRVALNIDSKLLRAGINHMYNYGSSSKSHYNVALDAVPMKKGNVQKQRQNQGFQLREQENIDSKKHLFYMPCHWMLILEYSCRRRKKLNLSTIFIVKTREVLRKKTKTVL